MVPEPTERLEFRPWSADDAALAEALWGDPAVTALIGGPLDPEQVAARLQGELANQAELGVCYWPMFLREGGTFVGCCGLRPYDLARGVYELGFHVCRSHWGQGIATEAARAVIALAFGELGAEALFGGHHPDNAASGRTLAKLGFRYTHHERYAPTGLMHPSYLLRRG